MGQPVECLIDERLTPNGGTRELQQDVQKALVLYRYLKADLSLGEAAELLNQDPEATLDWLASLGVPTARPMDAELEALSASNAEALLQKLASKRR